MDRFEEGAHKNELSTVITTGAIYAIFLVFGNSWSEFLKVAITTMAPTHDNIVLASLIYASSATFISLFSLFIVVTLNKCMTNQTKRLKSKSIQLKSYLSGRSRRDVANSK